MKNLFVVLSLISIPVLFFACGDTSKSAEKEIDVGEYIARGKVIADSAQKVLGSNLVRALNEGGTIGALEFCSVEAIPITRNAAETMGVELSRVSDKPRNQMNTADFEELKIIGKMKDELRSGNKINEVAVVEDHYVTTYYPILTQPLCMQCHGVKGKDINPETDRVIAALYPLDKATGYGINEVRGMWKVKAVF